MNSVTRINPSRPYIKEPRADQEQKSFIDICRHKIAQISRQVLCSINETLLTKSTFNSKKSTLDRKEMSLVVISGVVCTTLMMSSFAVSISSDIVGVLPRSCVGLVVLPSSIIISCILAENIGRWARSQKAIILENHINTMQSIRQKEKNENLECLLTYEELFPVPEIKNSFIQLQDKEFVNHASLLFTSRITDLSILETDQKEIVEGSDILEKIQRSKDLSLSEEITAFLMKPNLIELISYNQRCHKIVREFMTNRIPSQIVDFVILEYISEFDLSR